MASWEFTATGPVTTDIGLPAGSVTLTASPAETVRVSLLPEHRRESRAAERAIADTQVSFEGGTLTVQVPKRIHLRGDAALELSVELPEGSSAAVRTASADLTCTGELGSLDGHTASGDVTADRIAGPVSLITSSGDIRVREAAGDTRVQTSSGDAYLERVGGDLSVKTSSGDLRVREAAQSASVSTSSGDVRIGSIGGGQAEVSSVSGDISLAVPPGIDVYQDLSAISGRVSSELDAAPDGAGGQVALTLHCRSVSGDIKIIRTHPS